MSSLKPLCPDCREIECVCDEELHNPCADLPDWIYERHGMSAKLWWQAMSEETRKRVHVQLEQLGVAVLREGKAHRWDIHSEIVYDEKRGWTMTISADSPMLSFKPSPVTI